MQCTCTIDADTGCEFDQVHFRGMVNSHIIHTCTECGRQIPPGEKHEHVIAEFDGSKEEYRTCPDCLSLRDNFFYGWAYGSIWEDLYDEMESCDWEVPEACIAKLTPVARMRVCDMIERYWLYVDGINEPNEETESG